MKANDLGRREEEGRIGAAPCSVGSIVSSVELGLDFAFMHSTVIERYHKRLTGD